MKSLKNSRRTRETRSATNVSSSTSSTWASGGHCLLTAWLRWSSLPVVLAGRGCQLDDYVFQSGLNYANLKCQVVGLCKFMFILHTSTTRLVKLPHWDPSFWKKQGSSILLIRDMVVKRWNRRFGCETIHPTQKFISMNLLSRRTLWHFTSTFGSSLSTSSAYQRFTKTFYQLWLSAEF